jgi:hypothetical protein
MGVSTKYKKRFTYDKSLLISFKKQNRILENCLEYAAVHVRRGDYLEVASRVLNLQEYLQLLCTISNLLPKTLLFVSDSEFKNKEKQQIETNLGNNFKIEYLDGPEVDAFFVHCILREANLLITSNSTFSFSAALLAMDNQIALSPVQFHKGKDSEKYNRSFQNAGEFMLLKTSSRSLSP